MRFSLPETMTEQKVKWARPGLVMTDFIYFSNTISKCLCHNYAGIIQQKHTYKLLYTKLVRNFIISTYIKFHVPCICSSVLTCMSRLRLTGHNVTVFFFFFFCPKNFWSYHMCLLKRVHTHKPTHA